MGASTKVRVLLVSTLFPTPGLPTIVGGAEVVVKRMAQELSAGGAEISVMRAVAPGTAVPAEQSGDVIVRSLPIGRSYWPFDGVERGNAAKLAWHAREDIGEKKALSVILDDVRPEIIHTHNIAGLSSGVWRAAADAGIPIVHTLHDYYLLCPRTTRFRNGVRCQGICLDCRLLTQRRRRDSANVGDVVGVSRAVLGEHLSHGLFDGARQHVVPNSVEADLKAAPLLANRPVVFGFLGRITLEKGADALARAFGRMRGEARLLFAGRIDEAIKVRLLAEAGGRPIEFLGFVKPADFFEQIDVLVVPSLWSDPFPTVILEAQRASRPAIGSKRGGIPEAIGSEEAGWTYDPDDPDVLRDLLDQVADSPEMISAKSDSAKRASARFDADAVIAQYLTVYNGALAGLRRR